MVDEADRLQMNSLEQMRSIFDDGYLGMILIGMPGIEKRIARFPQLYSRIGFVHEFRPLGDVEMQELLERRWTRRGQVPRGHAHARSHRAADPYYQRQSAAPHKTSDPNRSRSERE